jgi:hypothetical protein
LVNGYRSGYLTYNIYNTTTAHLDDEVINNIKLVVLISSNRNITKVFTISTALAREGALSLAYLYIRLSLDRLNYNL